MTRGKLAMVTNNRHLFSSIEFNGEMYIDGGYGEDAINTLDEIEEAGEFREAVERFNEEHHKYDDRELVFEANLMRLTYWQYLKQKRIATVSTMTLRTSGAPSVTTSVTNHGYRGTSTLTRLVVMHITRETNILNSLVASMHTLIERRQS